MLDHHRYCWNAYGGDKLKIDVFKIVVNPFCKHEKIALWLIFVAYNFGHGQRMC